MSSVVALMKDMNHHRWGNMTNLIRLENLFAVLTLFAVYSLDRASSTFESEIAARRIVIVFVKFEKSSMPYTLLLPDDAPGLLGHFRALLYA